MDNHNTKNDEKTAKKKAIDDWLPITAARNASMQRGTTQLFTMLPPWSELLFLASPMLCLNLDGDFLIIFPPYSLILICIPVSTISVNYISFFIHVRLAC